MSSEDPRGRDLRIDVVRGLALLSMYVAHCAPGAGPAGVLSLSEYLTYPLFAALVGAGAQLADRRLTGPGSGRSWWAIGVRGAVLIGVGLLLEHAGAQIVIVLVYLGILTWVVAPLARARTSVVAGVGLIFFVAAPIAHDHLLNARLHQLINGHTTRARLLDLFFTGDSYRVSSMVFFAAIGILLTRLLLQRHPGLQLAIGLVTGLVAGGVFAAKRAGGFSFRAYDPTHVEHLFDALLLTGVLLVGVGVAGLAVRATEPLAWMGQMSLTLYVAQIYWLAYYVKTLHPGERDDSWVNVATLAVGSVVFAAIWRLCVRRDIWRRGPLEGATALLAHVSRRSNGRRPGRTN